jgi:flagellar basal body-associated protein FliL
MVVLEDKVVNLLKGGDYRYAKVGVTIEVRPESADFYKLKGEARVVAEKELVKGYEAALPLMLDAVGQTVGSRTSTDLGTPEGRATLKEDVHKAMGGILGEEEVLAVYFTDLVMQ